MQPFGNQDYTSFYSASAPYFTSSSSAPLLTPQNNSSPLPSAPPLTSQNESSYQPIYPKFDSQNTGPVYVPITNPNLNNQPTFPSVYPTISPQLSPPTYDQAISQIPAKGVAYSSPQGNFQNSPSTPHQYTLYNPAPSQQNSWHQGPVPQQASSQSFQQPEFIAQGYFEQPMNSKAIDVMYNQTIALLKKTALLASLTLGKGYPKNNKAEDKASSFDALCKQWMINKSHFPFDYEEKVNSIVKKANEIIARNKSDRIQRTYLLFLSCFSVAMVALGGHFRSKIAVAVGVKTAWVVFVAALFKLGFSNTNKKNKVTAGHIEYELNNLKNISIKITP